MQRNTHASGATFGERMRRNVVVLCLDSVRADTFAARATRLADLADVTLAGCRAASGWIVPSHASMLTGRLAHDHGAHALSPRYDAIDRAGTLTGDLDGHALGVSATPNAGTATGFDALFDEFHDARRTRPFQRGIDVAEALDPDEPCRQTRVARGTGGVPRWAETVFGESAAETYDRTRRGTSREGDAGEADA